MSTTEPSPEAHSESSIPEANQPCRAHSYRLTHPKNYVGVPLASVATEPADSVIEEHLVAMTGACKVGARALGYLDTNDDVTVAGRSIVQIAREEYGSVIATLETLSQDRITYGRFVDECPALATVACQPLNRHPAVQAILATLDEAGGDCGLPELAVRMYHQAPVCCQRLLVADDDTVLNALATASPSTPPPVTQDSSLYRHEGTYQFKSVLCHLGLLETPGADSTHLTPETETWSLTEKGQEVLSQ